MWPDLAKWAVSRTLTNDMLVPLKYKMTYIRRILNLYISFFSYHYFRILNFCGIEVDVGYMLKKILQIDVFF